MELFKKIFFVVVLSITFFNNGIVAAKDKYMTLACKVADSEMKRNPEGWMIDFSKTPRWNYTHGVVCKSLLDLYDVTGKEKYFSYVKEYADTALNKDGSVGFNYKKDNFNLDYITPGKIMFRLYSKTGDEKYKNAEIFLFDQLKNQPRTSEGGFWHKKVYPHQMWLDGLYMATPFLAEYSVNFNNKKAMDDVILQITLVAKRTFDEKTGLYTHAWDESREQAWCDKNTGKSHNFWGRSVGWYIMSLVDALDYIPLNHPGRCEVLSIYRNLCDAVIKYQDDETGLWYQLLDLKDRKKDGNYLESSCSAMFIYAFVKGCNKGYIDKSYMKYVDKAFNGFMKNFIDKNADGTLSITKTCSVAGLGGSPYRDGTFEYYMSEAVRKDDPKATGPFIMACIQLSNYTKTH
jgi:unsaturated rhamnogalacturonyl hydrolase